MERQVPKVKVAIENLGPALVGKEEEPELSLPIRLRREGRASAERKCDI